MEVALIKFTIHKTGGFADFKVVYGDLSFTIKGLFITIDTKSRLLITFAKARNKNAVFSPFLWGTKELMTLFLKGARKAIMAQYPPFQWKEGVWPPESAITQSRPHTASQIRHNKVMQDKKAKYATRSY